MVLKMLRSLTIALMSLIASEMCASYAQAATVTYYFEGEVNSIVTPWPTISTGTMISGTFTYDNSATPSSFGSGSGILLDNYYPAGVSYSFSIGGFSGTEDNSVVIGGVHYVVQHNTNSGYADAFEVGTYATTNVVSDGSMDFYISTFTLRLQDDTGSVFGDGSPPLSLSLADFTSATISMNFNSGAAGTMTGFVTKLELVPDVSSVPLPAALPLFLGGGAMLGFLARRRKMRSTTAAV